MGPCTASSCCCQVHSVLMGPCTASHCCFLHRHTLPCATFRFLTLLVVPFFV
ncbi:unnamed protein product, partial [Staurois parvus]